MHPRPRVSFVSNFRMYQVCASLGSVEKGATLTEISHRSQLSLPIVQNCLHRLIGEGFVKTSGHRYYASSSQMDFLNLKSTDGLAQLIEEVCDDISKKRHAIIDNVNNAIFYSAFSVAKDKIPELREKLKAAIFGVLDQYQNDEGECIRQVLFSFY